MNMSIKCQNFIKLWHSKSRWEVFFPPYILLHSHSRPSVLISSERFRKGVFWGRRKFPVTGQWPRIFEELLIALAIYFVHEFVHSAPEHFQVEFASETAGQRNRGLLGNDIYDLFCATHCNAKQQYHRDSSRNQMYDVPTESTSALL